MRRILFAALLAGLLPALSSEREQRFAFALPEAEGRISLGVFDSTGKLRRTLYVSAAETDFVIGLNGLIARWDGRDDFGQALPPGQYRVRGYLVTDELKAEGIAYHFNDWVDEKAPHITRIDDFRKQPGGVVVLAQALNDTHPLVFRFDQLRGFLWTTSLGASVPPTLAEGAAHPTGEPRYHLAQFSEADLSPPTKNRLLATTEHYVAVLVGDTLHLLDINVGTVIGTQPNPQVECIAAGDDALFVATRTGLT